MYSFTPASHVLLHNDSEPREPSERPAHNRRPEALRALANRATSASREILSTLVDTLEPSKMLKCVPVRFWQFIVAANLHLLRVSLLFSKVMKGALDGSFILGLTPLFRRRLARRLLPWNPTTI